MENAKTDGATTRTHTPGPWRFDCGQPEGAMRVNGSDGRVWDYTGFRFWSGDVLLGEVDCYKFLDAQPSSGFERTQDREQAEANARLIAAAPELLAALDLIASGLEADGRTLDGMTKAAAAKIARAALAKASA